MYQCYLLHNFKGVLREPGVQGQCFNIHVIPVIIIASETINWPNWLPLQRNVIEMYEFMIIL